MSSGSLTERLTSRNPQQELTTREAKSMGWSISLRTHTGSDGTVRRAWTALKRRRGLDPLSREFVTCADALRWVALVERGEVLR